MSDLKTGMGEKYCHRCGRLMEPRKKWKNNWDSIKYCSKQCRKHRLSAVDKQLEEAILTLLQGRAADASICPSDAARWVNADSWRDLLEPSRMAARRLWVEGVVDITQRQKSVDPSTAKGPIRIRRSKQFGVEAMPSEA